MKKIDQRIKIILFFQFATVLVNFLDINILRQFFVIIYISFVPGYLLIRTFRINLTNKIINILFSLAISLFILMFLGALVNQLYPLISINRPLSNLPFFITLNIITLSLSIYNIYDYSIDENYFIEKTSKYYFIFLPFISVLSNIYNVTSLKVIIIIFICIAFIISIIKFESYSETDIIVTIISISSSLLILTNLSSNYFLGGDINREFYVFKLTQSNSFWNRYLDTSYYPLYNYNSMLSITILPTIYSNLMNIEPYILFKYIFIFFSIFVPISLYKLYEELFDGKIALFSAFFFIADESMFFGMSAISRNRETIGLIFLILSIYLIVTRKIDIKYRYILFIIFGASLVFTYYAFSYIYFMYLIGVLVLNSIFNDKIDYDNIISTASIFILISIKLLYDLFISYTQIRMINSMLKDIYYSFFSDLLDPGSRQIEQITGQSYSIFNLLHKLIFYGLNFFILVGVTRLILEFRKTKMNKQYVLFSILGLFNIFALLIIPNLAPTINFARFRILIMIFLTPFIITGFQDIFSYLKYYSVKYNINILFNLYSTKKIISYMTIYLVLFFSFQVGLVNYSVQDKPISIILDSNRMKESSNPDIVVYLYGHYIPEQDAFSSGWLSQYSRDDTDIYADLISTYQVLHSSGLISIDRTHVIREPPYDDVPLVKHNYIYFNKMNVIKGLISIPPHITTFEYEKMNSVISDYNKIYSNGDDEIYWHKIVIPIT